MAWLCGKYNTTCGPDGGLVVSMHAFYTNNLNSNPTEVNLQFSFFKCYLKASK